MQEKYENGTLANGEYIQLNFKNGSLALETNAVHSTCIAGLLYYFKKTSSLLKKFILSFYIIYNNFDSLFSNVIKSAIQDGRMRSHIVQMTV